MRALKLLEGVGLAEWDGGPSARRMPGLPLLLAGLFLVSDTLVFARVAMCVLGSLLVPACYLLGKEVLGPRRARWLAVVATGFPTWVYWSAGQLMSDVPAAILVILTAWAFLVGARTGQDLWFAGGGVLWGLSTLTRAANLANGAAIVVWFFVVVSTWRRKMAVLAIVAMAFTLTMAPWSIRNALIFGAFVPVSTASGIELYKGNNPAATGILRHDHSWFQTYGSKRYPAQRYGEAERSERYQADALAFIGDDPSGFVRRSAVRIRELWKLSSTEVPRVYNALMLLAFVPAVPFFVIQTFARGWRPGAEMLMILLIVSQTVVHAPLNAIVRYRLAAEPLLLAIALAGLFTFFDRITGERKPQ